MTLVRRHPPLLSPPRSGLHRVPALFDVKPVLFMSTVRQGHKGYHAFFHPRPRIKRDQYGASKTIPSATFQTSSSCPMSILCIHLSPPPPVPPFRASAAWSLTSPATRRRLPQPLCQSIGTTPLQSSISFDYLGFPSGGHGLSMQDLAARGTQVLAQMMDGADERLNIRSASGKMVLRIQV